MIRFILLLIFTTQSLYATDITIYLSKVEYVKKAKIYFSIVDKDNYSKKRSKRIPIMKTIIVPVSNKSKYVFTFKNVPEGEYVISGFYDENNDKELETNWIGIPREPMFFPVQLKGIPFFNTVKTVVKGKKQIIKMITQRALKKK